jgi:phosphoglycerate kinase
MFNKKTIKDIDLSGKKVLVRVDYNVPANDDGSIADDYRIRQSLPTIQYLLEQGCKVVLLSHRGRPENIGTYDPKTSTKPCARRLGELLQTNVQYVENCVGDKVWALASHMVPRHVLMLENVRYHDEEEQNSAEFASAVIGSCGAEVFVQDGFGVVHRAHSSTDAMARAGIPAVAGLLLEREVDTITKVMAEPERPLMVVVGGAKISDKIEILNKFIDIADYVAVVGALANTFLLAEGYAVGKSLAEPNDIDTAKQIMAKAHEKSLNGRFTFYIPRDVVVAKAMTPESPTRIVDLSHNTWADINSYPKKPGTEAFTVGDDEMILDVGPFSASHIAGAIKLARTVIWNGTCGVTETKGLAGAADPFAHGTKTLVQAMTGEHGEQDHPFVVVGGGDTVSFVESQDGLRERLGHVSTGGGASLDLMAGKELPGVAALQDKD